MGVSKLHSGVGYLFEKVFEVIEVLLRNPDILNKTPQLRRNIHAFKRIFQLFPDLVKKFERLMVFAIKGVSHLLTCRTDKFKMNIVVRYESQC